eukprot:gnl/TRDRNA2_/TRDRNA2_85428_c0_seq1.p1 gnl/TRDRNA2_/TRDRNA2_85428_c0~~gnl/TRDRNA2_/TRDRNA2_85428_c0_seq1.p1  ORF type:complete len:227 (+),score=52.30 gnl/TRDRNA2_/TRDRNA2_85428_c0_seq1:54-734(+)
MGAGNCSCFDGLLGGGKASFLPKDAVNQGWVEVHAKLGEPTARVPKDVFVEHLMKSAPVDPEKRKAYEAYATELFATATAMMLPNAKKDVGKHCFGYASLLSSEFYADKPQDRMGLAASERPNDHLAGLRQELDADWAAVAKDGDGRVTLEAFKAHFVAKHTAKLSSTETKQAYDAFLQQNFKSSLAMMLPAKKVTLGGHCFRYGALMAGEFYFDGKSADVLGVTK